jgi:hypothetical protein
MGTVAARISQRLVDWLSVLELPGMAKIGDSDFEHFIVSRQTDNSSVLSSDYRIFQVALSAEIRSFQD